MHSGGESRVSLVQRKGEMVCLTQHQYCSNLGPRYMLKSNKAWTAFNSCPFLEWGWLQSVACHPVEALSGLFLDSLVASRHSPCNLSATEPLNLARGLGWFHTLPRALAKPQRCLLGSDGVQAPKHTRRPCKGP